MTVNMIKQLYQMKSKHSNYQSIPKVLKNIIGDEGLDVESRYETSRLEYILKKVDLKEKTILDIGGNTGFFSIESLNRGAKNVVYYEGNDIHCRFVKLASEILGIENKININNEYFSFDEIENKKYDITFLLNVIHHVGEDYANRVKDVVMAKEFMINQLNSLSKISEYLIFQLGFNWKGNCDYPLFNNGTKAEMIEFIEKGISGYWDVIDIGVAEVKNNSISYNELSKSNIERNDAIGEFLNRPIFILKSCNFKS